MSETTPPSGPASGSGPSSTGGPTSAGGRSAASDPTGDSRATSPGRKGRGSTGPSTSGSAGQKGNPVAWTALLVAAVLTVWQAIYSLTVVGVEASRDDDMYTSVSLFVTLVLGLAALVLGIVSIAQRRAPRWPGLVGLSVGTYAFIIAVFSWVGGLMNAGA